MNYFEGIAAIREDRAQDRTAEKEARDPNIQIHTYYDEKARKAAHQRLMVAWRSLPPQNPSEPRYNSVINNPKILKQKVSKYMLDRG